MGRFLFMVPSMIDPFLCEMLSPDGMKEGHAAVIAAYEWFTHASKVDRFEEIKTKGLDLKNPGGTEEEVVHVLGNAGRHIVCLSVYPKRSNMLLNKGAALFKIALHRDALPVRVGIDSTFGGTYAAAYRTKQRNPGLSRADVILAMVKDRDIVISYDPIPAAALRVCPKAAPDAAPSDWTMLVGTDLADVAIFEPDLMGNVVV
jgi:hypothetical protein